MECMCVCVHVFVCKHILTRVFVFIFNIQYTVDLHAVIRVVLVQRSVWLYMCMCMHVSILWACVYQPTNGDPLPWFLPPPAPLQSSTSEYKLCSSVSLRQCLILWASLLPLRPLLSSSLMKCIVHIRESNSWIAILLTALYVIIACITAYWS